MFNSIAAGGRDLAWAVGTEDLSAAGRPLLDWNGRHWIKDAVPGRPATGQMVQVSSASPGTAWALGYVGVNGTNLVLRWQGRGWVRVPVPGNLRNQTVYSIAGGTGGTAWLYPPVPAGVTFFSDLLPGSARSVWLTGYICTAVEVEAGCTATESLIARWNGSAWHQAPRLRGTAEITSISPGRNGQPLWSGVFASGAREPLLFAHNNGKSWSLERLGPAMRGIVTTTTWVAAVPGSSVAWAITDSQASASTPGVTAIVFNPGR